MSGFAPLSGVLRYRAAAWGILAFAGVQVSLTAAGIPTWACPIRAATGVPCPGCGMTHAVAAFARGHWAEALRLHPLVPVVALWGSLVLLAAVLPESPRRRFLAFTERIEGAAPWWPAVVVGFVVVWAWRYSTGALAHL